MEHVKVQELALNMQRFATNIRKEAARSTETMNDLVNALKGLSSLSSFAELTQLADLKGLGELKGLADLKKLAEAAKETTITIDVAQSHTLNRRHTQKFDPWCIVYPINPLCWIDNNWKRDLSATQVQDVNEFDPACVLNPSNPACRMGVLAEEPTVKQMSRLARRDIDAHDFAQAQSKWTPWCLLKFWMPQCWGMHKRVLPSVGAVQPQDLENLKSGEELTVEEPNTLSGRNIESAANKKFCFPWCVHPDWEHDMVAEKLTTEIPKSLSPRDTQAKRESWKDIWGDLACILEAFQGPHCEGA
jgi:hypothetical protein